MQFYLSGFGYFLSVERWQQLNGCCRNKLGNWCCLISNGCAVGATAHGHAGKLVVTWYFAGEVMPATSRWSQPCDSCNVAYLAVVVVVTSVSLLRHIDERDAAYIA